MSREIKFRAWHHGGGDSRVTGYMSFSDDFSMKLFWRNVEDEVLAVEVMQFTGLQDKNGNDIYEGDIVKHVRHVSHHYEYHSTDTVEIELIRVGQIKISPSQGTILVGTIKSIDGDLHEIVKPYRKNPRCWGDFAEIIGNIHENKDLLK